MDIHNLKLKYNYRIILSITSELIQLLKKLYFPSKSSKSLFERLIVLNYQSEMIFGRTFQPIISFEKPDL